MNKNEKGFNVKIHGNNYFLIFKDEGLYFKTKKKKSEKIKDLYIPFKEINRWDGICLTDVFFFKTITFNTLFKIYIILGILFLSIFLKYNFILTGLSLLFFLIVIGMLYIKTNYVILFADFEKIPIKLGNNRKICYLIKTLKQNCKKLSLTKSFIFGTKFKIRQMYNMKEDFKKELQNIKKEEIKE